MPPFIPYKSALSNPPPDVPMPKSNMTESLFDTADKPGASSSLQDNRAFLEQLDASSTESSLSDISTDAFEDVLSPPPSKRPKVMHYEHGEDEIDWEDIQTVVGPSTRVAPEPSGNLELTLDNSARMKFSMNPLDKKKGPSKIERRIRISTHRMHVQYLLFHNLIRNGWACDKEVQATLISQLPDGIRKEIDKWKVATGVSSATTTQTSNVPLRNGKRAKMAEQSKRNQRDWGRPAERQEKGANMSRGDPLIRLLKVLAAYWKKHFIITAPGLRKQGYKSLATIEEELASYKKNNNYDPVEYGERVESVQEFRRLAHKCEGSRDIGVLLFTSLVRGLEVEARLVASLQPLGFGWTKNEEASGKKRKVLKPLLLNHAEVASHSNEESEVAAPKTASTPDHNSHKPTTTVGKKRRARGAVDSPIDLSKDLSNDSGNDDASVIDVTPPTFRKRLNMDFDKDMQFPTYWTEVISPITNEVQPVDPLVLNPAVPTNPEQLAFFEPRGANADKAKQVFAYVVAYSPDGTAKEVTTRYLKRHVWPGRTKGSRLPIEKVPVHDRRGKIKFHEDYDWFKNLMRAYARTDDMRTAVDDLEEVKDLVAVKYEKKETNARDETLQGYKNSAEFVLERHLRREEALLPGSKPVKTFLSGKGDKAKKEPVYRRSDVEVCRTGESWHKEGRAVRRGEYPMKMVPVRAVTLTRKREVEEAERDGGEKLKQGLYALHQTDW